jgi:predicted acyltransferase
MRATALDALRGLAILAMVLVALQPDAMLPSWMYHAQEPPPTHHVVPHLDGLTWPDIVFPFFLFSLGAALPLALGRRIDRGESKKRVLGAAVLRGALLLFFSVFRQHFDASVSPLEPETVRYVFALLGFAALSGIFIRLPSTWTPRARGAVRGAGWLLVIVMFAVVRYPDGSRASLERSDYILKALGNVVILGSVIWMFTRRRLTERLFVLGFVVAFRLGESRGGWAGELWDFAPYGALLQVGMAVYLCAVIPGTIIGDAMTDWMKESSSAFMSRSWSFLRCASLLIVALAFTPLVLVGVQGHHDRTTVLAVAALAAAAAGLATRARAPIERFARVLVGWGSGWLLVGLLFDVFQERMNKVDDTLSWLFASTGLAVMTLLALLIVTDLFQRHRAVKLLVDNGQNPMFAYVGSGMLILPIVALTGIKDRIEEVTTSATLGFARGVGLTVLVALTVRFFTRRGWFWRT